MPNTELICMWIAEIVTLCSTLFAFLYGVVKFFKKGKPLYLQTITMAMGCHTLSTIYHICQTLTIKTIVDGFTPAYLGRIGFFLFFIASNYGQMDRILDDGSKASKPSRFIALIAPIVAVLLYLPNAFIDDVAISTKITYALVWLPAIVSVYFTLKHAIIPDMGFGFIKAIKPFNIIATCLCFAELLSLTAWNYLYSVPLIISTVIFSVFAVLSIFFAEMGVKKWTI